MKMTKERYSRQTILDKIGIAGQKKLSKSSVAVVGVGALGSSASQLLARAGIGKILLIDKDKLELHNLQRQILFKESDCGKNKAKIAASKLRKINPEIEVKYHHISLNKDNINFLLGYDIILGCTDNLESRFLINEFCVKNKIPWVHGGAIKTVGNLLNVIPSGPCFRCIFTPSDFTETANNVGIVNSIPVIIGAMQAIEAIKIILGKEYEKKMLYYDVWTQTFFKITIAKNNKCPVCNNNFEFIK
ncbi:MAG: HesA/MoeB/ThiF family protein [archaeon]